MDYWRGKEYGIISRIGGRRRSDLVERARGLFGGRWRLADLVVCSSSDPRQLEEVSGISSKTMR